MLKRAFELFLAFAKALIDEKIALTWSLIIPLIIFLSMNYSWFSKKPDLDTAIYYFAGFWAFTVVIIILNGVGLKLSEFRESGFLKSLVFICGSKTPIILGLLLSQIVLGFVSLFLFNLTLCVIFDYPFLIIMPISLMVLLVSVFPLFLMTLFIPSLSIRTSTAYTIVNIFIFPATYLAVYRDNSLSFFMNIIYHLNPVEYVYSLSIKLYKLIYGVDHVTLTYPIISSVAYILMGLYSWKRIKISSTVNRT